MISNPNEVRSPDDRIRDLPRIEAALRLAVREALLQHKRAGNSIAVWRNGQVEWLQPEDIPVDAGPSDRDKA